MVLLAFLVPLAFLVRDQARDNGLDEGERHAQFVAQALAATRSTQESTVATVLDNQLSPPGTATLVVLPTDQRVGDAFDTGGAIAVAREGSAVRAEAAAGIVVAVPVVTTASEVPLVVAVLVTTAALTENVLAAWAGLGLLGLLLLAIAVTVADRIGRSTVRPVQELGRAAHLVGEGDLSVRVDPAGPPEVVEVATSFNALVGRITALLDEERESVADTAHRLRTPLTALKLEAEDLSGEAGVRIRGGIDDLERSLDFVIAEARRSVRAGEGARSDAVAVTQARAEFWSALAEEQQRPNRVDVESSTAWVPVAADDLEAALDALLGNVFTHTPEGTAYAVGVRRIEDTVQVVVADRGPGLDADSLDRGVSGTGSSGLGLDIARRTAERAGGLLHISAVDDGGTRVALVFPVLPPSA